MNNDTLTGSIPKVSIILPIVRPAKAMRCIRAIHANIGMPPEEYEIISAQDEEEKGCPAMVKELTAKARADLICFLGDDTIPEPGFMSAALHKMEEFPDHWGLVALNDGIHRRALATHWLAHKRLLDHLPSSEFFSLDYRHCFSDRELTDIADSLGRYAYAPDARIIHDHPQITGEAYDEHYAKVYDAKTYEADQTTYWKRKRARNTFKLGIGLPVVGPTLDVGFFLSYVAMEKPNHNLFVPNIPPGQFAMDYAAIRNDIALQALEEGCTHLLFIDTDQNYPGDVITKLLTHINEGDIVTAPVHRRYPPFDLILLRGTLHEYRHVPDDEAYSGDLIPIDATGTGCMLINTECFLDIPRPWFEITQHDNRPVGEDINFCHRVRSAGKTIVTDTSIAIDHIARVSINRTFREIFKRIDRQKDTHRPSQEVQL